MFLFFRLSSFCLFVLFSSLLSLFSRIEDVVPFYNSRVHLKGIPIVNIARLNRAISGKFSFRVMPPSLASRSFQVERCSAINGDCGAAGTNKNADDTHQQFEGILSQSFSSTIYFVPSRLLRFAHPPFSHVRCISIADSNAVNAWKWALRDNCRV